MTILELNEKRRYALAEQRATAGTQVPVRHAVRGMPWHVPSSRLGGHGAEAARLTARFKTSLAKLSVNNTNSFILSSDAARRPRLAGGSCRPVDAFLLAGLRQHELEASRPALAARAAGDRPRLHARQSQFLTLTMRI